MEALESCFLHFDALIDVVGACNDPQSLGNLAQVCKAVKDLCYDDKIWHKCYGPVLSIVLRSNTTWRERMRSRKLFKTFAALEDHFAQAPTPASDWIVILPPGEYREFFELAPGLSIEGYILNESGENEDETIKEDSTEAADKRPSRSSKRPIFLDPEGLDVSIHPPSDLPSPFVFIKNVTIRGARVGIWSQFELEDEEEQQDVHPKAPILIENCIFEGCQTGVTIAAGCSAQVIGCDFRGCTKYGTYVFEGSECAVTNCVFGGAAGLVSVDSKVTIEHSKFLECSAVAINIIGSSCVKINNCTIDKTKGLFGIKGSLAEDDGETRPRYIEITNCTITRSKMHGVRINNYPGKFVGNRVVGNLIGMDLSASLGAGQEPFPIEGNEVLDNLGDGIYIFDQANAIIRRNTVIGNKGKGIYVQADCQRVLEENESRNNLGGDEVIEPFVTSSQQTDSEKTSTILEAVREAVRAGACTFTVTGPHYVRQTYYDCITCKFDGSSGICESCRNKCHKDHDTVFSKESLFFCDCGMNLDCPACK